MLSRRMRATYYLAAGPFMALSGYLYRSFKAPREGKARVHLGPGQKNYIEGWINVDANIFTGKADVWADLRYPLPFHDETIDCIYSHHMIEHLPNMQVHFSEVWRCLKPGGVYRVGGPNGDAAIKKFIENDVKWFYDFPDSRISIGGRFENFISCRGEHLTILSFSFLDELLTRCGFVNIRLCKPVIETNHLPLFEECLAKEHEFDFEAPHTIIVEAEKPLENREGTRC